MQYLGFVPAILLVLLGMTGMLTVLALNTHSLAVVMAGIITMGGLQGITNTLFTEAALNATQLPRNIASSSFSAFRFLGGAIFPPCLRALVGTLGRARTILG